MGAAIFVRQRKRKQQTKRYIKEKRKWRSCRSGSEEEYTIRRKRDREGKKYIYERLSPAAKKRAQRKGSTTQTCLQAPQRRKRGRPHGVSRDERKRGLLCGRATRAGAPAYGKRRLKKGRKKAEGGFHRCPKERLNYRALLPIPTNPVHRTKPQGGPDLQPAIDKGRRKTQRSEYRAQH